MKPLKHLIYAIAIFSSFSANAEDFERWTDKDFAKEAAKMAEKLCPEKIEGFKITAAICAHDMGVMTTKMETLYRNTKEAKYVDKYLGYYRMATINLIAENFDEDLSVICEIKRCEDLPK